MGCVSENLTAASVIMDHFQEFFPFQEDTSLHISLHQYVRYPLKGNCLTFLIPLYPDMSLMDTSCNLCDYDDGEENKNRS